jgi:putative heme-binding domain-containing protein
MHVAEGADFGWRLRIGARCCSPDSARGAVHGELPGKVPSMLKTGRGSPAGLLIYNDTRFPEKYRGLLLYPDVFRKLIRAYEVEPRGATFAVVREFEFMKSDDPLFRPCQMVLGPDGAMYVVDWRTDSGGAGKLWGDGKHGRIYRITWAGTKDEPALPPRPLDSWAGFAKMSDAELLKTLSSEEASFRTRAQQELVRRGENNRPELLKLLADEDAPQRARIAALGALQSFWNADVQKEFVWLLREGDPDLRRLAAEGVGLNAEAGDKAAQDALLRTLSTDNPCVRRAVALAMGRLNAPGADEALVNALAFDDGKDPYLLDGLVRAIERLGKPGIERLLALGESGVAKDTHRVVEAFTMMRTRPAYEALPTVLRNPHLSEADRAALIRSYNNFLLDPPVSVQPVFDYLTAHPGEPAAVRRAALEVLSSAGALKDPKASAWLLKQLKDSDPALRLLAIKAVESTRLAQAAAVLARFLGDAARPAAELDAALKALRVLPSRDAVEPLKKVLAGKADGAQARALRREAFRTLAVLDPAAASASALEYLADPDANLQREAVAVLGASPDGTRLVAKLFLEKKLPRGLLPQVSDALRKHAPKDAELAKALTAVMRMGLLIENSPQEQARIRALVQSQGNPQRGRALYLNGKTLACITCHRLEGVGGNVGPDLTRLWETHTVEKIMESIIEPSKEIKEGYQAYQAVTTKGQVLSGLKISQTADEVVLRDANGRDVRVAAKDLEELTPSKVSLMPDNVISQLTYDQFIDLVAFLKDRKAQESLRGLALDFHVVGPFGPDLKAVYPPEAKADPLATYSGAKPGEVLKWQPAQAEPSGLLNLRAVFNRDGASAYALTYVYSPKEEKAEMLLGCDDLARVWVGGQLVHESKAPHTARPDQYRVALTLKPGWTPVLAKVVNDKHDHGLYLRFVGEGLQVARTPHEVK